LGDRHTGCIGTMSIGTVSQLLEEHPERSVWSAIMEQNAYDMEILKKVMNREFRIRIQRDVFDRTSERLKGQWHFGMISYNIKPGSVACKHACTYCYETPTPGQDRYGRPKSLIPIEDMMPSEMKKVQASFPRVVNSERKMYFFPSTCDVFVENAKDYISVCEKLIDAGHEIFFVTKPSIDRMTGKNSVEEIVRIIETSKTPEKFKTHMRIFVTITTDQNQLIHEYEPNASPFEVRINTVRFLIEHGFHTNIMMEPYLSDPVQLSMKLLPMLSDGIIAIGRMNYTDNMPFVKDNEPRKQYFRQLYSRENLVKLWEYVKGVTPPSTLSQEIPPHPRIFLKKKTVVDMIKLVL
jgi:DNA repair photolyase